MKIGTSNIHNAIKFTVSIAYDAYVDIFYGRLLFHEGRFVFVSKNIFLVLFIVTFFSDSISILSTYFSGYFFTGRFSRSYEMLLSHYFN